MKHLRVMASVPCAAAQECGFEVTRTPSKDRHRQFSAARGATAAVMATAAAAAFACFACRAATAFDLRISQPRSLLFERAPLGRLALRGHDYRSSGVFHRASAAESGDNDADSSSVGLVLADNLPDAWNQIVETLRNKQPQQNEGIQDHELPPLIPRKVWNGLASLLKEYEEYPSVLVPANRWITLRLDGCGWTKVLKRLKESGVLASGFSDNIAGSMIATCQAVMCEFGASLGYTQSDEMTIIVPPTSGTREHLGDMQAWVSIASSIAAAEFNQRLADMAMDRHVSLDAVPIANFDCRVGVFSSAAEAEAMIVWRSSDCNMNSASDAIKFSEAPFPVRYNNTIEKLVYLQNHNLLPLPRHQAYGSLLRAAVDDSGSRCIVLVNGEDSRLPKNILNLVRIQSLLAA